MGLSLVQRIGPVDPAKTDFRHRLLGIWFCACLMVYMMAHVLFYEYLPKVANLWMHKVSFVGYLAVSITLYHAIRKEKVAGQMSLPPELPHADASPDEPRSSGVAGQE